MKSSRTGLMTLRHAGLLVRDLKRSVPVWKRCGFKVVSRESLKVVKLRDQKGQTVELVQGRWHPHLAVDWYDDGEGNYLEIVRRKK